MSTTMKLIAKNVLGSNTATVTFSDIPGTYTDLLVLVSARQNNTDGFTSPVFVRFNGSSSSYSMRNISYADIVRSAINPYNVTSGLFIGETPGASMTANTMGIISTYVPTYAGATNKSASIDYVSENNGTADYTYSVGAGAGLWSNTSAITSVSFHGGNFGTRDFVSGSSFFLYGITKA